MMTEPWSLVSLLTFLRAVHFFAGSSLRLDDGPLHGCLYPHTCWAAASSAMTARQQKTFFVQNTGNFIHRSSYHLLCEGVLVTSEVHHETAAVNCRICKNAGMQTTISIHDVELLLGHKGIYSRQLILG